LILGMLAVFTGLILSVGGAYLLATFLFKIPFKPDWSPTIWVFLGITSLTVLIGLFNSREVVNLPPLEVLRSEVG
jgi:putative ABC transport system permease protein